MFFFLLNLISTCQNIFKTHLSAAIYHIIHDHVNTRDIAKHHSKMSTTINNPISFNCYKSENPADILLKLNLLCHPNLLLWEFLLIPTVALKEICDCFSKTTIHHDDFGDGGTPLQTQKITLHCLLVGGTMCGIAPTPRWSCDLRSSKD